MTIRIKELPQKEVNNEELTSLLALALLCDDFSDDMPATQSPGSGWLRWGDAIAAGQKGKESLATPN